MAKIGEHEVGAFLKHLEPSLVLEKFAEVKPMTEYGYWYWKQAEKIATGERTHKTHYDEHYYEGPNTPKALAEWLMQWGDEWQWECDTEASGRDLYVYKDMKIPYTDEEIEEAKKYIATFPKPEADTVKFRNFPTIGYGDAV